MKAAALLGTLSVAHRLPAGARVVCSPGQEVVSGEPIAECRAPRRVRAVSLKYLDGAAVGDTIPAGTTVGDQGGWRRRRQEIDWDARIVALNPAGGIAFLSGPEIRSEILARIGGVVGAIESGRGVEITGEGLAMFCPIARGPSVFGSLELHRGNGAEPRPAYPEATVLGVDEGFDPSDLIARPPQNLSGLLLPGIPDSWLADGSMPNTSKESTGPAPITFGAIAAVTAGALPEALWSILEALSGCPVSLCVDPDTGTGELVVSGPAGSCEFDNTWVRGFSPGGVVYGRCDDLADGLTARVADGRLLAGARVLVGQDTHLLAAINVESVISNSASGAGCG